MFSRRVLSHLRVTTNRDVGADRNRFGLLTFTSWLAVQVAGSVERLANLTESAPSVSGTNCPFHAHVSLYTRLWPDQDSASTVVAVAAEPAARAGRLHEFLHALPGTRNSTSLNHEHVLAHQWSGADSVFVARLRFAWPDLAF